MTANADSALLTVQVGTGANDDAEGLDLTTRQLLAEIRELKEIGSATLQREGATPEGTKSVDPVMLGQIAVAVLPAAVPTVIAFLQSWALRGEGRTVKIKTQAGDRSLEIEYSPKSMSQAELMKLVDEMTRTLEKRDKKK
ncbi:MAG: hypothetical protein AAB427_03325 [Chloroflexota bacterium]